MIEIIYEEDITCACEEKSLANMLAAGATGWGLNELERPLECANRRGRDVLKNCEFLAPEIEPRILPCPLLNANG